MNATTDADDATVETPTDLFETDYDPTDPSELRERIEVEGARSNAVERLLTATVEAAAAAHRHTFEQFEGDELDIEFSVTWNPETFTVWNGDESPDGSDHTTATLTVARSLDMRLEEMFVYGDGDLDARDFDGIDARLPCILEKVRGGVFSTYE